MKKILLAGATGYLGSYIAKELRKRDYHVRVIARNPERLEQKKIEAKEMFVEQLKKSGLDYCIARPNGFFSDMSEFYNMAQLSFS